MRPKLLVVSLAASLALVLTAAPAFGQDIEARAGEDVVASVPTPAADDLTRFGQTGQVQPFPDLVPLPWFFPSDGGFEPTFCLTDGQGRHLLRIGNEGFGPAPQTTTQVSFGVFPPGSVSPTEIFNTEARTPPIPAGRAVVLPLALPRGAIEEGYVFGFRVDSRREADEIDESNNLVGTGAGASGEPCPPGL